MLLRSQALREANASCISLRPMAQQVGFEGSLFGVVDGCVYVCLHTCSLVCMYTYTRHVYLHTYIPKYIHTYIHTDLLPCVMQLLCIVIHVG